MKFIFFVCRDTPTIPKCGTELKGHYWLMHLLFTFCYDHISKSGQKDQEKLTDFCGQKL